MAKNELTFENFISDLADLVARYQGDNTTPESAPAKSKGKASKAKTAKADPEPEADEEEEGIDFGGEDDKPTMAVRRAALMKQRITTTRKQVIALGYAEAAVKDADKETLVETVLAEEYPDEDGDEDADVEDVEDDEDVADDDSDEDESDEDEDEEADDEDEEEEEDEEADEYDRETLEGLNLRELKRVAKEEFEFEASDLKGQDQETIIAMILGEDAAEDEDEESDEDEEDEDVYTEDELKAMTLNDLKALNKAYGLKVKPNAKKAALVNAILELGEEE